MAVGWFRFAKVSGGYKAHFEKNNSWSNRPQNTANKKRVVCFYWFLNVIVGFWGIWIIPKLLINDSWSIAIHFGTFLERPTNWPNMDPRNPYLSPNASTNTRKLWEHLWQILFSHLWIWNSELFGRYVYLVFGTSDFDLFDNLIMNIEIFAIWKMKIRNL